MIVYFHEYFTNCSFADLGAYSFCQCDPIQYEAGVSLETQYSDLDNEIVGIAKVWDEQGVDYDEF